MPYQQRQVGSVVVVDLTGKLVNPGETGKLKEQVTGLLDSGHKQILLNFVHVKLIDSAGLGELAMCRAAATNRTGAVKLACLPPRVKEPMVWTRIITLFDVFETEQEAIDSFGPQA